MENPTVSAVVFDLDGTLLDTAPEFADVLNAMLIARGQPALPFERIRAVVSHGARALVTLGFGLTEHDDGFEALRCELLDAYARNLAEQTQPFTGIRELLRFLDEHGIGWGVVTNKPSRFTEPLLSRMAIEPAPRAVVCPDHVEQTKPHPEPMLLASRHMGVRAPECLCIGDHRRDIESGRRAGMRTIAARWGYVDADDIVAAWEADYTVDSVDELHGLIRTMVVGERD